MSRVVARIAICFLLILMSVLRAAAYDEKTTHPALTDEIINFYNSSFPDKAITPEEREWVVAGSRDEDEPPRWINHFFDPIKNEGWTAEKEGGVPAPLLQKLSVLGLSSEAPLSAPEWLNSYLVQEAYRPYGGNRTWKRGLEYFAAGSREEAYKTLGHALHLLEDMSVPEHTRNDSHAPVAESLTGENGSPYEQYAAVWTRETIGSLKIGETLTEGGARPPELYAPADYLAAIARYSNSYLFSKDTINDAKYANPKIVREDEEFGYGKDEEGSEFPLTAIDKKIKNDGSLEKTYTIKSRQEYYPILSAYFSRLAKKDVLYGAGMVHLFQKEAADALVNRDFPEHVVKLDTAKLVFPTVSLYGIVLRVEAGVKSAVSAITSFVADSAKTLGATFSEFFKNSRGGATISTLFPLRDSSPPEAIPRVGNPEPDANPFALLQARLADLAARLAGFRPTAVLPASSEKLAATPLLVFYGGAGGAGGAPASSEDKSTSTESASSTLDASPVPPILESEPPPSVATTSAPLPIDGQADFARYNPQTFQIEFSWQPSPYFRTPSSSVRYRISEIAASTSTLVVETAETSYAFRTPEMGREFIFEIRAEDEEGRESDAATSRVRVPSFLSRGYFYADWRPGHAGQYVFDAFYPQYPFIPAELGNFWQGMVFYYDAPVNYENHYLPLADHWQPHDGANIAAVPQGGAAIFGISPESSNGAGGGNLNNFSFLLPREDLHLRQTLALPTSTPPNPADYLTIGYYDFYHSGGGTQDLKLSIPDNTKYPFLMAPPPGEAPTAPAALSANFSPDALAVQLSWSAASDPDSADSELVYEVNYTTSTEFNSASWQSVPNSANRAHTVSLEFPNHYRFAVRARDDSGNISPSATLEWDFPSGFFPVPRQTNHGDIVMSPNGAGQKIVIPGALSLSAVVLWGKADYDSDNFHSYTAVEIRADEGGAPGALLGTSSVADTTPRDGDHGLGYGFSPPLILPAGVYWIVPLRVGGAKPYFYGASGNPYLAGDLGGAPDLDLYFELYRATE